MKDWEHTGWSREMGALLDAGRNLPGVPQPVRQRVRRRLMVHQVVAAVVGLFAWGGSSKLSAASLLKIVSLVALTGIGAGAAVRAWSARHTTDTSFTAAPVAKPVVVIQPAPSDGAIERALATLSDARQSLAQGHPERALKLLDDGALRSGPLAEEVAAARVISLCAMRARGAAGRERLAFEARWPQSALRARVDHACISEGAWQAPH